MSDLVLLSKGLYHHRHGFPEKFILHLSNSNINCLFSILRAFFISAYLPEISIVNAGASGATLFQKIEKGSNTPTLASTAFTVKHWFPGEHYSVTQ